MSACISSRGEYSSHELDDLHTCIWCGVLDEDALRSELAEARASASLTPTTEETSAMGEPQWTAETERLLLARVSALYRTDNWALIDMVRGGLAALAEAGLLLPPGGQTRREEENR